MVTLNSRLVLNRKSASNELKKFGAQGRKIRRELASMEVGADTSKAKAQVKGLADQVSSLDGRTIDLSTVVGDSAVKALEAMVSGLEGRAIDLLTTVADADVDALEAQVGQLDGRGIDLVVTVDDAALAELRNETSGGGGGGVGAIAAPVGLGAGIGGAVTSITAFDDKLREVATLLPDLDTTGFERLGDEVFEVSKLTGNATSDTLPALYDALSAGVPRDNVFDFLETANETAVGGVTDLTGATNLLTTGLNAFKIEASDVDRVSDAMFTTVRLGKTTIGELERSLGDVAPSAKAANVSIEETGASLAVLTANGLSTPKAATALNTAFTELQTPTTKIAKAFEEINGKSFPDFLAGGGTMIEALGDLRQAADNTNGGFAALAGQEASKAFNILTDDVGKTGLVFSEFDDTAGATAGAFDTIASGPGFRLRQFFTGLKTETQEALTEQIPFLEVAVESAEAFLDWASASGVLAPALALLAGSLSALALGAGGVALFGFIAGAGPIVLGIAAAVGVLSAVLTQIEDPMGKLKGGLDGVKSVLEFLNPLWEGLLGFLGEQWAEIEPAVTEGLARLERAVFFVTSAFGAIDWATIGESALTVARFVGTLAKAFLDLLFDVLTPIISFLVGTFTNTLELVGGLIGGVALIIGGFLSGDLGQMADGFEAAFQAVLNFLENFITDFDDAVLELFRNVGESVSGWTEDLVSSVREGFERIARLPGEILGSLNPFSGQSSTPSTPRLGYTGGINPAGQQMLLEGWASEVAIPLEGPWGSTARQLNLLHRSGLYDVVANDMRSNVTHNRTTTTGSHNTTVNHFTVIADGRKRPKRRPPVELRRVLRKI